MIKLIKSTFYEERKTKKALIDFIAKVQVLSFSDQCIAFEKEFSAWQGRNESVFVNSGSSANLAVIQALLNTGKLKKGDKVGFSAVTWSTNVMPLIQLGLEPVPVDVELDTLNVSPATLLSTLNGTRIKLLFLTNLLGFVDDIIGVAEICKNENILLIEDNCESLGTIYKGVKTGNFGYASTFSFYVGHHMSTIEGGAVCTDDEEFATQLRIVRAHGWDRNLAENEQIKIRKAHNVNSSFYSRYTFYDLGYNLRPTEINGFLGRNQLRYIDEINEKRNQNFLALAKTIYKNPDVYPVKYSHLDFVSNFAVPVVFKSQYIRNEYVKKCDNKVEIRPIVGGNISDQPFFSKYSKIEHQCSNAILIHKQGLYFGNNPELSQSDPGSSPSGRPATTWSTPCGPSARRGR